MRGLKQIFPCLALFGNNKFIDGKIIEHSHLWGKNWQLQHNNFRLPFKETVSKHAARMTSMLYIFNGGKWGDQFQYEIGNGWRNLKDPDKPAQCHPALKDVIIPQPCSQSPLIERTKLYNKQHLKRDQVTNIFYDDLKSQLQTLLNMKYPNLNCDVDNIIANDNWQIRQISSFTFHNGHCSFHMNFNKTIRNKLPECIVKLIHGYIMSFTLAFEIQYMDQEPAYLCKGQYWPIHESKTPDTWVDDFYSSMDYINKTQNETGWCFMTNIAEPVFLIHNCVNFSQIKKYLPEQFKDINNFDYIQNISSWCNQIHRWQTEDMHNRFQVPMPCGPVYTCKRHHNNGCVECVKEFNVYPEHDWNGSWKCNVDMSPHFYIFDKKNGLVMTLMKTCAKYVE